MSMSEYRRKKLWANSFVLAVTWIIMTFAYAGIVTVFLADRHPWVTWMFAWVPILCVSVASLIYAMGLILHRLGLLGS